MLNFFANVEKWEILILTAWMKLQKPAKCERTLCSHTKDSIIYSSPIKTCFMYTIKKKGFRKSIKKNIHRAEHAVLSL